MLQVQIAGERLKIRLKDQRGVAFQTKTELKKENQKLKKHFCLMPPIFWLK